MKTNLLKEGVMSADSIGLGTATRQMVRERAVELAIVNGRSAQEVSKSDWDQAKLELNTQLVATSLHIQARGNTGAKTRRDDDEQNNRG